MWYVKAKIIPIIISALGMVTKGLNNYLKEIPGQHTITKLQKKLNAQILRKI